MDLQLKNKLIIVTGGAKGIGLGICKVLADEGAIPVIIGRNEDDNKMAVQEIVNAGGRVEFVTAELTKEEECENAVKRVIQDFGRIGQQIANKNG